jgi:hypothetical protein
MSFQQNNLLDENEYLHMKNEMLEKELHEQLELVTFLREIIGQLVIHLSRKK